MQDTAKTPGELTVTPAEMIDYVRTHAVEHATQTARDRVNFFFTFIAVLFAIVSAVGAAVLIEFNSRLETIASSAAAVAVEKESEQLSRRFAAQIEDLETDVKQEIRAFSKDLLILPLLVAEASKADQRTTYNAADGDRIIAVLEDITDTIQSLSGEERTLALRMLESIIDNFYRAGDYTRIYKVYNLLGNESLELGGFHITMLRTIATSAIIDPARYLDSDLYDEIINYDYDANDSVVRANMLFARMIGNAIEDRTASEAMANMYSETRLEVDSDYMDNLASEFIRGTRPEFVEGGLHHSPAALERFERISAPIEAIILEDQ